MSLTLEVCISLDPPRVARLIVTDPALDHVCTVCGELDNEDDVRFDMWACGSAAGWVHRYCHELVGCHDGDCDPAHH